MVVSPPHATVEKRHWWITNRKVVEKYVRDARTLISSPEKSDVAAAINLLDAALALSPRFEQALELKARLLLYLRRYKDVADMLQDYIPSLKMNSDDLSSSSSSSSSWVSSDGGSQQLSRERVKLLSSGGSSSENDEPVIKCFSVSDLKKKIRASLGKKEEDWLEEVCRGKKTLVNLFSKKRSRRRFLMKRLQKNKHSADLKHLAASFWRRQKSFRSIFSKKQTLPNLRSSHKHILLSTSRHIHSSHKH